MPRQLDSRDFLLLLAALSGVLALVGSSVQANDKARETKEEFQFVRLEYNDLPGVRRPWGRGWWMQDSPEAETHFSEGVRRLTRIKTGEATHLPLTEDRIFDYPWVYATQVGYWDLRGPERKRLRDYLMRGGFLVVDDFYGDGDWKVFQWHMEQTLPGLPIVDVEESDPMMHVLFSIRERTFIPGLRHLRRGSGGTVLIQPREQPPRWRAIYDAKGRMIVAINFNMDIGDAWEHADTPEYPAEMTILSYHFGINYLLYSMTH